MLQLRSPKVFADVELMEAALGSDVVLQVTELVLVTHRFGKLLMESRSCNGYLCKRKGQKSACLEYVEL